MEVQLDQLIEKIKKEGIDSADQKSNEILAKAETEASSIISKAKNEAGKIIENAKNEALQLENSGKEAIKQASRDLLLDLKQEIEKIFNAMLKDATAKTLSGDTLKEAVSSVLNGWKEGSDVEILVPEAQMSAVEKALKSGFSQMVKDGLTVKPVKDLDAGFKIALKDGSAYYDFSDEEVSLILSQYMNPRIASILNS